MSKESETNREGFGSHAQRHQGGQDPQAAKRRRTGMAHQADGEPHEQTPEGVTSDDPARADDSAGRRGGSVKRPTG